MVIESSRIVKSKYFHFHKSCSHKTNECVHMKDVIEELIKKGSRTEQT